MGQIIFAFQPKNLELVARGIENQKTFRDDLRAHFSLYLRA